MSKKPENQTLMDEKVRRLVAEAPHKNLLQIGKEAKRLGFLTNERSIYKIVKTDVKLQGDLQKIYNLNKERLSTEGTPLALDVSIESLKEKPDYHIPCPQKENEIVKAGSCKKCTDKLKCESYKQYKKEDRIVRQGKYKWAKTVIQTDMGGDESRRPIYPTQINIETLQVLQSNQLSTITRRLEEMEEDDKQAQ